MFLSKVAVRLGVVCRASGSLPVTAAWPRVCAALRAYSSARQGNTLPPQRWTTLEPELEETLVPRKLALSPLESWLSLRYTLPSLHSEVPTHTQPHATQAVSCKNVLEIRRRKMNRHKYKKLLKRRKFIIRKVRLSRSRKKQKRFEKDLTRIWRKAGLKRPPKGWVTPKIYIRQYGKERNTKPDKVEFQSDS